MFSAQSMYGAAPAPPVYGAPAPVTQQMATDDIRSGWRGLVDPNNPLFWVGAVLAVTVGAAGVAGHIRVGKATLAASVDNKGG